MATYIETKEVLIKQLTCSHPSVERIWEYGGLAAIPTDGIAKRVVCLKIKGVHDPIKFIDKGDGQAIEEAEFFLQKQQPQ